MRDETVEIVDSKGQKLRLKISTTSTPGQIKDGFGGYTRDINTKLTGWNGAGGLIRLSNQSPGNWKAFDLGFLQYHAGLVLATNDEGTRTVTTKTIILVNIEGTWGMKLFNYYDVFGVNEEGEGTVAITWVTGFAAGRFSWSLI